jgi:hypothetical protein
MGHELRKLLILFCAIVVGLCAAAAQEQSKVVSIGIPPMQNTSRRSVQVRLQRDRLVRDFQQSQKKKKKDAVSIVAVPLDAYTPNEVSREAQEKNCDYIVTTELVELRTAGDPQEAKRRGSISIGSDPLGAYPGPPKMDEPVHRAVVEYRLFRVGDPQPLLDLSVSGTENSDENETVSRQLGQIVNRVLSELRERRQQ